MLIRQRDIDSALIHGDLATHQTHSLASPYADPWLIVGRPRSCSSGKPS